jgi:hypothetical protein
LLEKTIIPVISPNLKLHTPNIIKRVVSDFPNSDKTLIETDNCIHENEARMDALIFRIYGFNVTEVDITMKWLSLHDIYQQKVIDYLRQEIW